MPSSTAARWVFTINNPSDNDGRLVSDFLSSGNVTYGVVGRETGASGTPHLQGFVILRSPQRRSYLRNRICPRGHYERANGTSHQAATYCKKDGDFDEYGTLPERQGNRSDLDEVLAWVDEFTTTNGRPPASPDIAKHHPRAYLKYPRLQALASHRAPQRRLEFGEPNEWQREFLATLEEPVDDRTIHFYVDTEGGKGKTWLCRYLLTEMPDDVQVLGVGKKSDLAYMVDETKHIFLFNVGRGQMEYLSYSLLEALKDKMLLSTKYQGRMKTWPSDRNTRVIVFSNELPDETKLTADRYWIKELD